MRETKSAEEMKEILDTKVKETLGINPEIVLSISFHTTLNGKMTDPMVRYEGSEPSLEVVKSYQVLIVVVNFFWSRR